MGLFDKYHREIAAYIERKRGDGRLDEFVHQGPARWPGTDKRNLVLSRDTAVELGNPGDASTSFLYWLDDSEILNHGRITIIGPDLPDLKGRRAPFGKVVIVGGQGFDETNSYERYREMESLRYKVQLKGYMMRGVSQYMREWSRVSHKAVNKGFSFRVLGGALIDGFSRLDYVRAVETIFITSSAEDVLEMRNIADGVMKIYGAMNKMAEEMSFDCDSCDYNDVCGETAELRSMRKAFKKREAAVHA